MTVLDYLVRAFVKRNERHLLALVLEFPSCQEVSKMKINEIVGDHCRKELELMKSDQRGKSVQRHPHCTSPERKKDGSSPGVERLESFLSDAEQKYEAIFFASGVARLFIRLADGYVKE
jgi:hypothetical protein